MLKTIYIVALFATAVYSYKDCGSTAGSVVSVTVSGCTDDGSKCILRRNTTATIDIEFVANSDSDTLVSAVHGIILGVPVRFIIPNENGCKDSGITCPIKGGQTYKYRTALPVSTSYPRVTVDVKWELIGEGPNKNIEEQKDYICVIIPSKIK